MINFIQNISVTFVVMLYCLLGYNPSQPTDTDIQSYIPEQFVQSIEQGILDSKTEINLYYNNDLKDLQMQIQKEIPRILKSSYFCNKLLRDIDDTYNSKEEYNHVKLNLFYDENVKLPIFVAKDDDQIMSSLINGWTSYRGKVTIIIHKKNYSEEQFFSLIDTAEINSALIPCEAQQVLYEEFPKEGDWQIVRMWLGFAINEKEILQKQAELKNKIDEYSSQVKSMDLKNIKDKYKAIYDIVTKSAVYDQSIALLSKANRLDTDMYLDRSAYGALISGKTICNGYARAFKSLCDNMQLPCWVVSGTKDGVKHAWNIIVIDKKEYFVDCTFGSYDNAKLEDTFLLDRDRLNALGYVLNDYFVIPNQI